MPPTGPDREADIVVVGAGLAGLLAATRLALAGLSVAILAPPRGLDRRTTALLGTSIEAIGRVGAWAAVKEVAQRLRAIRVVDATDRLLRAPEVLFEANEMGLEAFGYNVPNEPLLASLENAAAAAGVVSIPSSARDIRTNPEQAIIETESGETIATKLVVAADGHQSACRSMAGIDMVQRKIGQGALVCDIGHEIAHDDISTEFHLKAGPFTLVPLGAERSSLVWVTRSAEAERLFVLEAAELARAIEEQSSDLLGRVTVAGRVQMFNLRSGIAEHLAADRMVLIGEAAHVFPPIGAQGFNLTIRDIEAIAGLVEAAGDDCGGRGVTRDYERARRPDIELRLSAVQLLNGSLMSDFLPIQLVRGAGLFALASFAPLRHLAMREGLGGGIGGDHGTDHQRNKGGDGDDRDQDAGGGLRLHDIRSRRAARYENNAGRRR